MSNTEPDAVIRTLIADIETRLNAATSQACADLDRARSVVNDASVRLDRSFRALHSVVSRYAEARMAASSGTSITSTATVEILGELDAGMAEAVRALQFEDMVTQVLHATMQRVSRMSELSIQALRALETDKDKTSIATLVQTCEDMNAAAQDGPVQQNSLDHGSIELF